MYSEQITFVSFDQACELWYAAQKYLVPGLAELCSQYMVKDLHPDNACRALEFAILYEDSNLKVFQITFCIVNHKSIFSYIPDKKFGYH